MDMQDKDFDKLFNQKFEDFEVEPSQAAWDNIAAGLDGKKATRTIMPWMSIAATVLVVAIAGLLFMNKGNKTDSSDQQVVSQSKATAPVKEDVNIAKQTAVIIAAKPAIAKANVLVADHRPKNEKAISHTAVPSDVTADEMVKHESAIDTKPVIASVANPAATKTPATLPDVQLRPRTSTDVETVVEVITATVEPEPKRGIHNMGGLINALVAKIDKRDTKLIEFSDDEDDDNGTKLSGINLGLIKIKKQ